MSECGFLCLEFNGVGLEIVPSDEKVSSSATGAVPYWAIDDLDESLAHVLAVRPRFIVGLVASKAASRCAWCATHGETAGRAGSEPATGAGTVG